MKKRSLVTAVFFSAAQLVLSQSKTLMGFSNEAAAKQYAIEQKFDGALNTANVDKLIKDMSARPHHVGSPGDKQVADYIFNYFKDLGFDTRIETFYILFPTPKERLLEMTEPVKYKALLSEPPLKEDATSGQTKEQLPVYNCYSADGDVTGELVYVNYGLPEDYEKLSEMGIEVKGKIVIAKYGRSWRGIKPKVAQEHGALGCIIYSDPKDDGYYQGDVYPKGAFKNEYGAERGSVMDMPIYPGDPLTPGYAATEDAKRLDRSQAANLLKIPVLPISYHDAEPLLRSLEGPVAPADWRGALPFAYHAGPGKTKVHLKLSFNWDIKPINNIIGTIKGSELPDEWVIRGNHHDAWVNGANDPISGLAALMEEAKGISALVKSGWKPRRTLIYCAWDGEEPALLGSTEWVEQHQKELQEKAVVYINSDGNGRGFLGIGGSHALENFVNEVAADVTDPQTGISVLERKRARDMVKAGTLKRKKELLTNKQITMSALGSGSDYSPFFQHAGITSFDVAFGGEDNAGEYHSIYDSYDMYRRFKDPKFEYGVALAKVAGRITMRMADAELLPFDFRSLYKTINGYATELMEMVNNMRDSTQIENQLIKDNRYTEAADPTLTYYAPAQKNEVPYLDFAPLQNALAALGKSCDSLQAIIKTLKHDPVKANELNKKMYRAEQELLLDKGLPRRGWYRHSIYAPGFYTGYGVKTLPGIREAIEQRKWNEAQEQIAAAAGRIEALANYLGDVF